MFDYLKDWFRPEPGWATGRALDNSAENFRKARVKYNESVGLGRVPENIQIVCAGVVERGIQSRQDGRQLIRQHFYDKPSARIAGDAVKEEAGNHTHVLDICCEVLGYASSWRLDPVPVASLSQPDNVQDHFKNQLMKLQLLCRRVGFTPPIQALRAGSDAAAEALRADLTPEQTVLLGHGVAGAIGATIGDDPELRQQVLDHASEMGQNVVDRVRSVFTSPEVLTENAEELVEELAEASAGSAGEVADEAGECVANGWDRVRDIGAGIIVSQGISRSGHMVYKLYQRRKENEAMLNLREDWLDGVFIAGTAVVVVVSGPAVLVPGAVSAAGGFVVSNTIKHVAIPTGRALFRQVSRGLRAIFPDRQEMVERAAADLPPELAPRLQPQPTQGAPAPPQPPPPPPPQAQAAPAPVQPPAAPPAQAQAALAPGALAQAQPQPAQAQGAPAPVQAAPVRATRFVPPAAELHAKEITRQFLSTEGQDPTTDCFLGLDGCMFDSVDNPPSQLAHLVKPICPCQCGVACWLCFQKWQANFPGQGPFCTTGHPQAPYLRMDQH